MRAFLGYVLRQWAMLALLLAGWAIAQSFLVCEGLWQGSGLSGNYLDPGSTDGGQPVVISVWKASVQALVSAGLSGALVAFGLWRRRRERAA